MPTQALPLCHNRGSNGTNDGDKRPSVCLGAAANLRGLSEGRYNHRVRKNPREECMAAVEQKVKQIIVEQLGVDESQVDTNASFVDDLGADSLDIVELVMAFEEAFELEIPDEDAEKITTVKDAIDYIEGKTTKK